MFRTKIVVLGAVAAAAIIAGAGQMAHATVITQGFESTSGYTFDVDGSASLTRSTDVAHAGTHSAKFAFPASPPAGDFAKVVDDASPGQLQVGTTNGTFWVYVPNTSHNQDWIPYMYYGVDTNRNGTFDFTGSPTSGDSFVIAYYGVTYNAAHVTSDTWMQSGIYGNTNVHVVGNRTGLGSLFTTARPAGVNGDTFSGLGSTTLSPGVTWGDLDILQFRVGTGAVDTSMGGYVAYVDDIMVSNVSVPEPSELGLFALGLLGLAGLVVRRRRMGAR